MKKLFFTLLFTILVLPFSYSQELPKKADKRAELESFKAKKMAYLIAEVAITPEEAAQLFPLYNEMQEKRFLLKMALRNKSKILKENSKASDEECMNLVDEFLEKEIQDATLEKAYYQRFKRILSPQKLLKLKQADYHFAKELLKKNDQRTSKDQK
jgi:hypothetical protein